MPDLSATQALRRLVPLDVAKKLIFSGEPVSGEQVEAAVARLQKREPQFADLEG